MIIDLSKRTPKTISKPKPAPKGGMQENVAIGDVVEVEHVRNNKTIYKGR